MSTATSLAPYDRAEATSFMIRYPANPTPPPPKDLQFSRLQARRKRYMAARGDSSLHPLDPPAQVPLSAHSRRQCSAGNKTPRSFLHPWRLGASNGLSFLNQQRLMPFSQWPTTTIRSVPAARRRCFLFRQIFWRIFPCSPSPKSLLIRLTPQRAAILADGIRTLRYPELAS